MRKTGLGVVALLVTASGCRDVDRFSTAPNESYCGQIVAADIVRGGFQSTVCTRLTLDGDHFADKPGVVWTDDALFTATPLRPIPQLSHDPMLTFTFGEGREKNLLFAVDPTDPARGPSLMAVVSLMHTGDVEMRLFRGAPGGTPSASGTDADASSPDAGTSSPDAGTFNAPFFGVFSPLRREEGNCAARPECAWTP